ncbi:ABC-F family ATP-binding cassette domain-containing protein [uncultured Roseobacter sp.]|uniref:ABC-F family ATP-binding cassette domain-containing protein n=1 Tax=uncultured Roseobacter sp. TaxID=114847 RepID=UPI002621D4FC|nr:ABC-F family ATP-binding cassette domain-containing protein [uncultured Roseobacter sp.]
MSSIVLANLSWATPAGNLILSDIDATFGPERTGLVGRNGIGKTTLLRLMAGEAEPASGSITRPAVVGLLRQNPEHRPGDRIADLFGVGAQLAILTRAADGEATEDDLAAADWTLEDRLKRALVSVGLDHIDLNVPVSELSGGQRTRASLAALFFCDPDMLLLDEPTNHLDRDGRQQVIGALRAWRGGMVVASHDRTLLAEMDAIVELTGLGAKRYGGNYDAYREQKNIELAAAEHELAHAERVWTESRKQAQVVAERKARTDRQGRKLRASGGQPKILLDARKERSENSGGATARMQDSRVADAAKAMEEAREKVEALEPLRIDVPTCGLVSRRHVLDVVDLSVGYDPRYPILKSVSLRVRGPERLLVEGANGAGKSTLLSCIMGALKPWHGSVSLHVSAELLDQDIGILDPNETVLDNFARLDPDASENEHRAVLARFLFRGGAVNQIVGTLSGGQQLRAGLACVFGRNEPPQLLLLDEPSNHLDIEATETLEAALRGYDGALLVVSHDSAFIDRIGLDRVIKL